MAVDYTSFNGPQEKSVSGSMVKRWWLADKVDRPQSIAAVVQAIAEYDSKRQTQYQISTRLYGNSSIMGVNGLSYSKITSVQNSLKDRISYNVIQSVIDTLCAKIAKNKPRPLFLTSGGDFKLQRKAKKLNKFTDGIFYENKAYQMGIVSERDACVFGDGIVHVFGHNGRVKWERVIPSELYVDQVEAFYGEPRQMHRVKNVDRDVMVDMFPGYKSQILNAHSASYDLIGAYQNVADQITVVESWHLPSGPEASDGLHTISIQDTELFNEEWKKPYFPFAKLSWSKRLYGFWGQGLAEQIQNIQLEINKLLWVIQRSMHLAGTFKIWLKNGSKVVKEHLNNDIGAIITGDEMPQYLVPPIVAPEIYQHLQTLKESAYEQSGISQLSASSEKPAGLNSGKALREYNDIESDRFLTIGQAYEQFYLDLGRLSIDVARELYGENRELQVKVPGKKFIETIDWKEVDLDEDEYVMNMFPVSSLPNDPAGRLQTIQEYMQAGLIDPLTGKKLLNFPDLEQEESLSDAQEDWITETLDAIIDDAKFSPPEPEMNYGLAKQLVLQYIAQAHTNNLDPDRMDYLRQFNNQLELNKQKAAMAMQPMPPTQVPQGGGQPQAQPQPMPQSDLIQNAPGLQ